MITAARILEILNEYGTNATFRTYASQTYAAGTGQVALGTKTDAVHKILPPYTLRTADLKRWSQIDGIKEAQALSAVAASGLAFTPAVGMEVLYENKTWLIKGVNPIRTAAEVVLFELALVGKA